MNEKLAAAELAAITPLFCSGGAKYHRQGGGRAWVEVAGAAVRGEAAARRPGSEELLHERLSAARVRRCAPASSDGHRRGDSATSAMANGRDGLPLRRPARRHGASAARDARSRRGPRRLRGPHRRLLGAAHERRLREEQPVRAPRRARHARARLRARPHVAAHRRAARDGDRLSRHQRLEVRRADLRRRHDLRELPHRRAARQQVEADAGDRDLRRRGRQPGRARRAARPQGAARVEGAA